MPKAITRSTGCSRSSPTPRPAFGGVLNALRAR
jgi:hypothetical protein